MRNGLLAPSESPWRLLVPVVAPVIWAVHFTASYIVVAIWCGPEGPRSASMADLHTTVAVVTGLALAGIVAGGWIGWRWHQHGSEAVPHDFDTPGDHHRFLGFATLLLAGLSAFGTALVGGAVFVFETCR
jgi:hypothetical protein